MTLFNKKTGRLQPWLRAVCGLPPGLPLRAVSSHPHWEQGGIAGYPRRVLE